MGDEMHALGQRIGSGVPRVVDRPRAEWFKAPNEDELFKTMEVELKSREKLKGKRSSTTYPLTGTTPNFGDIWYISDADLEAYMRNVCETVCAPGAIRRVEAEGSVSLIFKPHLCTGCNSCQQACLFKAITPRRT